MTWVVDTCVILDILDRHPEFAEMSSRALQSKLDDVLAIAPVTYVELSRGTNISCASVQGMRKNARSRMFSSGHTPCRKAGL